MDRKVTEFVIYDYIFFTYHFICPLNIHFNNISCRGIFLYSNNLTGIDIICKLHAIMLLTYIL